MAGKKAALVVIGLIGLVSWQMQQRQSGAQEALNATGSKGPNPFLQSGPSLTSGWTYSENKDEMRGATEKYAEATSANTLNFEFPYSGGSTGTLTIRRRKQDGLTTYLTISKGQFVCHRFTGGRVAIKFDDGPIQHFPCSDVSDGRSDAIFIEGSGRLVAELKKAKRAIIEAEFYKAGAQQLTFDVAGLKWN